jgi:hypothetical protein
LGVDQYIAVGFSTAKSAVAGGVLGMLIKRGVVAIVARNGEINIPNAGPILMTKIRIIYFDSQHYLVSEDHWITNLFRHVSRQND